MTWSPNKDKKKRVQWQSGKKQRKWIEVSSSHQREILDSSTSCLAKVGAGNLHLGSNDDMRKLIIFKSTGFGEDLWWRDLAWSLRAVFQLCDFRQFALWLRVHPPVCTTHLSGLLGSTMKCIQSARHTVLRRWPMALSYGLIKQDRSIHRAAQDLDREPRIRPSCLEREPRRTVIT